MMRNIKNIGPFGPAYAIDLLNYLQEKSPNSLGAVLGAIQAVRLYGPSVAKAQKIDDNLYIISVHIGWGLDARIELERDRKGILQPVIAEIVKP